MPVTRLLLALWLLSLVITAAYSLAHPWGWTVWNDTVNLIGATCLYMAGGVYFVRRKR